MEYVSKEHKHFYEDHKDIASMSSDYAALVYTLGINRDTRQHFKEIYDESLRQIIPGVLHAAWQTNASIKITRLAFNLYTYQVPEEDDPSMYAPKELLSGLDNSTRTGALYALMYFC